MNVKDNLPSSQSDVLKRIALIAVVLCVAIQLSIQFCMWGQPQISDCAVHESLALAAYEEGAMYPTASNIYDIYILAPVMINFLVLQLAVFNTLDFNWVFNLLFNLLITYELFWLGKKYFSRTAGYLAVVAWSMLYSVWTSVYPISTEVLFLALSMSTVCLCLRGGVAGCYLGGAFLALANGVRPLVIIFIPTILIIMILNHQKVSNYIAMTTSAIAVLVLLGTYANKTTGYFTCTSTTGGVNLIIQAHDGADGSMSYHYESILGDLSGMDYAEKDKLLKEKAIQWIKEHPDQYAKVYFFKKLPILYYHDTSFDGYFKEFPGFSQSTLEDFLKLFAVRALKSVVYYAVMILFLIALFRYRKNIFSVQGAFLLIPLLGTLATCVFQTMPRYHYPLLPFIILWAVTALPYSNVFKTKSKNEKASTELAACI